MDRPTGGTPARPPAFFDQQFMSERETHDIVELARAKVNLTLKVVGRLPNGYHALESLVAFAETPADIVTLSPGPEPGVTVTGPGSSAIVGENLVARALQLAAEADPELVLGHVTLDKHLPVAAGVGGGSADAAAILRAVRRANPSRAQDVDWPAIALKLGADVPVCLDGRAALMWGVGERILTAPALPELPTVIVNPMQPVPADKTAQVFRRLGAAALPSADLAEPQCPAGLRDVADVADVAGLMRAVGNDLEPPAMAVVPAIAAVKAAIAAEPGCLAAQLSGGGPTCFGVFATTEQAAAAAAAIRTAHPTWWVAATRLG